MTQIDVLNLGRISREISKLEKIACRLEESRRKMRDAVKADVGNGGDDWKALRAITAELISECDRSLHADLERAATELRSLSDGIRTV